MGKPSPQILAFMERYKVDADEIWEVRAGGAWAIKHMALERVAVEQKITFDPPVLIEHSGLDKNVAILVTGRINGRTEWSIGEASPLNYKTTERMAAYPYAIAEKRGKDRVILKLLQSHGALYSEDEADDFKRQNPHVTRPEDIYDPPEYDDNGQPIDNIPNGDPNIKPLPKKNAKEIFAACQSEIRACGTIEQLTQWGGLNKDRVAQFPADWQEIIRGVYADQRDTIRSKIEMDKYKQMETA